MRLSRSIRITPTSSWGSWNYLWQKGLITRRASGVMDVVITPDVNREITAKEAAKLAGITYRQLDHWARQGWITPSVQGATGRGGRRLYSADDVLRLASLRHFGKSGWPVSDIGEQLASVDVADARFVVATSSDNGLQSCVDINDLLGLLATEQQFSVFDLTALQEAISGNQEQETLATHVA